jgi:hypothetical protein
MKTEMNPSNDPAKCPLCSQPNHCAVAADPNATECWCEDLEFPQALLDQVPNNDQDQTCICRNCLDKFLINIIKGGG